MAENIKAYPTVKCELSELVANQDMSLVRKAVDDTLERALKHHTFVMCGVNQKAAQFWETIRVKYNLDEGKNYAFRMIEGKPYICEMKEKSGA